MKSYFSLFFYGIHRCLTGAGRKNRNAGKGRKCRKPRKRKNKRSRKQKNRKAKERKKEREKRKNKSLSNNLNRPLKSQKNLTIDDGFLLLYAIRFLHVIGGKS